MKLLLTSLGTTTPKIMDALIDLVGKAPHETRILFITTAAKLVEKRDYLENERKRLLDRGFMLHEYDIEGKTKVEIAQQIEEHDGIYVMGGKPFYLLKAVRESGIDSLIKQLPDNKVYIGQSAGVYLVCPTLATALWKKPNRSTYGLTDLSGIGLVDFLIIPHYEEKIQSLIDEKSKETPYKVVTLTDAQAIVVSNRKVEII